MMGEDGQNFTDLQAVVADLNRDFAPSLAFVFLPGDNADDGSVASYTAVRKALESLTLPWFAIVGDHDVHERSYDNFRRFMGDELRYAFTVGDVRFVAMNAFEEPRPDAFVVSDEGLAWLERELSAADGTKVVLLHCYPSELKVNGPQVAALLREHDVRVVAMGHTHYNEVANDGRIVYTATRSTGQVEEGPVGHSISNLDGDAFSWRFFPLHEPLGAMIVSPCDERLMRDGEANDFSDGSVTVRARVWGASPVRGVWASLGETTVDLAPIPGSNVWQGTVALGDERRESVELGIRAEDEAGHVATDGIRLAVGTRASKSTRCDRDVDNALEAWEDRGLLGTQLGPNKNGRKW